MIVALAAVKSFAPVSRSYEMFSGVVPPKIVATSMMLPFPA